jgi:hypothetical protein
VQLKNPQGLKDIAIAVPRHYGKVLSFPEEEVIFVSQDEHFYYFYLQKDAKEIDLSFKLQ